MSTCFKNLINESKEDISFEKISDLELGMEIVSIQNDLKILNAVDSQNVEILNNICNFSTDILFSMENRDNKYLMERYGIDVVRDGEISNEAIIDFFKKMFSKLKKGISRTVERVKVLFNKLKKVILKIKYKIEDLNEEIDNKIGKERKSDNVDFKTSSLINPDQQISELPKLISNTKEEILNYLEGSGIDSASKQFLKLIDAISVAETLSDFLKAAIKGADVCVEEFYKIPVSKSFKTIDINRNGTDLTGTLHGHFLRNASLMVVRPKGGFIPKEYMEGNESANLNNIRKMNECRVFIANTNGKYNDDKTESITVMSVDDIRNIVKEMEILSNAVDSFDKNGVEKHNKIKLDCIYKIDKEIDAIYKSLEESDYKATVTVMSIIAYSLANLVDEPRLALIDLAINSNLALISLCEKMLSQYE